MSLAVSLVRRVTTHDTRFRLHNWLCSRRTTTRLYTTFQPKIRSGVVGDQTDLVLEGFPRSANTYALAAFRCANGPTPVVASHLHSAASIIEGIRRRLPVIVVVRNPIDACASLIQRQSVTPRTALIAYLRFYSTLAEHLDDVVISDFAVTTTAFGSVLESVNRRFRTDFAPYELTAANEEWCREFVTEADRVNQGLVRMTTVALPQPSRQAGREAVREAVCRESQLVERALERYRSVLPMSG